MGELFSFDLQRDQLSMQVADRLQHLIVAESLKLGDQLPGERELAKRLGVSRTVVREALRVLADRGLLKVKQGCGTFVCDLSPKDAAAPIELPGEDEASGRRRGRQIIAHRAACAPPRRPGKRRLCAENSVAGVGGNGAAAQD